MKWQETIRKVSAPKALDAEYQALSPKILQLFESYLRSSWWVILFLLMSYLIYHHSVKKLNNEYAKMHQQYAELMQEKRLVLATRKDYLLQINSQSDQDWVELTLMKVLSLVPEEQIKVFFSKTD